MSSGNNNRGRVFSLRNNLPDGVREARWITAVYLVAGLLWILFSDAVVTWLAPTAQAAAMVQVFKGAGFILVTAALLYPLLHRLLRRIHGLQAEAEERERRLALAMEGAGAGYWYMELDPDNPDPVRQSIQISPRVADIAGLEEGETASLTPEQWREFILPADLPRVEEAARAHLDGEADHYRVEYRLCRRDGELRWVASHGEVTRDGVGRPVRFCGMDRDITAEKQAAERLELWAQVFRTTSEGVAIADARGRIIEVNAAFERITGYRAEQACGDSLELLESDYHDQDFHHGVRRQVREQGHWQGEIWHRRADDSVFPDWMAINAMRDARGEITHYIAVFADISRLKEQQRRLDYLEHFDALTGLPNRNGFLEELSEVLQAGGRHACQAILVFDVDYFARINQTLGDRAGDQLLKAVAGRIGRLSPAPALLARIGSDAFALVLDGLAGPDDASDYASALLNSFREPFALVGEPVHVSVTIGVAVAPEDGKRPDRLLQAAESALRETKRASRQSFGFHSPDITHQARERLVLERELREALECDDQLILYFQPKVTLGEARVTGLEALVRWQHPRLGLLSPGAFIPLAEETGLILPLGHWVLNTAVRMVSDGTLTTRKDISVAVNLSGMELGEESLPVALARLLEENACDSDCLELEITETLLMHKPGETARILESIRALGVSIAVDDFGTGYSSLSYLQSFPLDRLKIDRSFVNGVPGQSKGKAIARAIMALGQGLELAVTAEGVETEAQARWLHAYGCESAQGYLFSRPVPVEALAGAIEEAENTCRRVLAQSAAG